MLVMVRGDRVWPSLSGPNWIAVSIALVVPGRDPWIQFAPMRAFTDAQSLDQNREIVKDTLDNID
jgi:hypothetical protein